MSLVLLSLSTITGIAAFIASVILIFVLHNDIKVIGKKRTLEIEKELPNFISNFTNSIKFNRNIIEIIETYKNNYDTPLTKELAITVMDMRTGSPELALQRFDARVNIPLLSSLIRGVLATLHGEDMTIYFGTLVHESRLEWQQNLTKQALKVKPKISGMSMLLAVYSVLAMLVVIVQIGGGKLGGIL